VLPPAAASLDEAHAAIELWEHYKRRTLDPAQRLVVEVLMATRSDGLWAAPTTGREMPRQNGKGDEIEVVELWGLVQRSERILHTVHDAVLLATESQSRLLSVLEGHPDLRKLVSRAWRGTGQQMIELRNGGIIWYRTRTGGGARGVDEVDRIVVDEAQHAEEEHMAAITPTQLASVNPQTNAMGSAGITNKSVWWWRMRRRGLSSSPGDFGYVGHTAEPIRLDGDRVVTSEVDVLDRGLWRASNPALVAGRASESFFVEQLFRLGPALFAREHMGVWDPEPNETGSVIDGVTWAGLKDDGASIASHRTWSLAVSPDRSWSSFGIAGRTGDGLLYVQTLVDGRRKGTDWVLDFATEAYGRQRIPLRVHKSGPESSFVAPLRERGVEVVEVSSAEVAQATGQFIDAANARQLRHLGQSSLDVSVRGAMLRTGTDGAALWSQRNSMVEITALMACTVAAGGVSFGGHMASAAFALDDY
jgi:hypothetical protein